MAMAVGTLDGEVVQTRNHDENADLDDELMTQVMSHQVTQRAMMRMIMITMRTRVR